MDLLPAVILFEERQRLRQPWLLVLVLVPAALAWASMIQQIVRDRPVGTNPVNDWGMLLIWLLIGVGLPAFIAILRLETIVDHERVLIRFRPLTTRSIPGSEIRSASVRSYRPMREFGGWGLRGFASNRAYTMNGNTGVQLVLTSGDQLMIGSERPEELATAIAAMLSDRS